jgi:hypothetical protein
VTLDPSIVLVVAAAPAVAGVASDFIGSRREHIGVVARSVALDLVVLRYVCAHCGVPLSRSVGLVTTKSKVWQTPAGNEINLHLVRLCP